MSIAAASAKSTHVLSGMLASSFFDTVSLCILVYVSSTMLKITTIIIGMPSESDWSSKGKGDLPTKPRAILFNMNSASYRLLARKNVHATVISTNVPAVCKSTSSGASSDI